MKKSIFALLSIFLFLASCAVPQTGTDTPIPLTPTALRPQATQTVSPTATSVASTVAWVAPTTPTTGEKLTFDSLDMSAPTIGWGIDILGRIFHTTDGGEIWTLASPPDGAYTSSGFFALDGNTAWAAKDVPLRCWDYWALYQCDQPYYAAVTSGVVWKTTNGGQTWEPSQPFLLNVEKARYSFNGALPFAPVGLQFIDSQTGWLLVAVGQTPSGEQSLLYQTSDGGMTWKMIQIFGFDPKVYPCQKRGLTFSDKLSGWLVAACRDKGGAPFPMFLRTTDGGVSWSPQIPEVPIPSEWQIDPADGYIEFEFPLGGEHFQRYPDGSLGVHLENISSDWYYAVVTFFRLGNQVVDHWISGVEFSKVIYKTSVRQQGGWMTMDSEYFLDKNYGWRLYWDLSRGVRSLQKTTDGGQKWESTKSVAWTAARFEFVDTQTGWAIVTDQAGQTALVKTTDGGQTWSLLAARVEGGKTLTDNNSSIVSAQSAQLVNIAEFWMIDSSAGWAVTMDDQVIRTIDGASTWQNVTPPPDYKAYESQCFYYYRGLSPKGFFALDAAHAWVARNSCSAEFAEVWKTTDGGQTWQRVPFAIPGAQGTNSPPFIRPISLSFVDVDHGWLAVHLYEDTHSLEGYIFQTEDGGKSWQLASENMLGCLVSCSDAVFSARATGWLAYDARILAYVITYLDLLHSTDGGKTWEEKIFAEPPPIPENPILTTRMGKLDGSTLVCGTRRLQKFPDGNIGAYSSCNNFVAPYFSIDYLIIIDANNSFKVIPSGMAVRGNTGDYEDELSGGWGGWTTNQSEFFYNNQLGWRLYIGTSADENGPVYLQHTQDGGDTWETIAPVPWTNARFQFLDPQNGWALVTLPWGSSPWGISYHGDDWYAGDALLTTTDGGKTWEEIKPVINP